MIRLATARLRIATALSAFTAMFTPTEATRASARIAAFPLGAPVIGIPAKSRAGAYTSARLYRPTDKRRAMRREIARRSKLKIAYAERMGLATAAQG